MHHITTGEESQGRKGVVVQQCSVVCPLAGTSPLVSADRVHNSCSFAISTNDPTMETLRNWTCSNVYHLTLLTLAYIIGEVAHFLINTTAREARSVNKERVY